MSDKKKQAIAVGGTLGNTRNGDGGGMCPPLLISVVLANQKTGDGTFFPGNERMKVYVNIYVSTV